MFKMSRFAFGLALVLTLSLAGNAMAMGMGMGGGGGGGALSSIVGAISSMMGGRNSGNMDNTHQTRRTPNHNGTMGKGKQVQASSGTRTPSGNMGNVRNGNMGNMGNGNMAHGYMNYGNRAY